MNFAANSLAYWQFFRIHHQKASLPTFKHQGARTNDNLNNKYILYIFIFGQNLHGRGEVYHIHYEYICECVCITKRVAFEFSAEINMPSWLWFWSSWYTHTHTHTYIYIYIFVLYCNVNPSSNISCLISCFIVVDTEYDTWPSLVLLWLCVFLSMYTTCISYPCFLTRIRECIHTQDRDTTCGRGPSVVSRC